MVRKSIATIGLVLLLPTLAACGGQPGGTSAAETAQMTAFNEPSRSVPDYSVRGAGDLVSIGIGFF